MNKSTQFRIISTVSAFLALTVGVTLVAVNLPALALGVTLGLGFVTVLFFFSANATAERENRA